MKSARIIFWQQHFSPHQTSWIRALSDLLPPGKVVAVFEDSLPSERLALGWNSPTSKVDYGQTKIFIRPGHEVLESLIHRKDEVTTHVFSGNVHVPAIDRTMRRCLKTGDRIGILTEARDSRGFYGSLRVAHSYFYERRYRRHVDFVLTIGRHAYEWYQKCGFRLDQLFPFCYSVEKSSPATDITKNTNEVILVFVGQLIPRKGIDLLLRALKSVRSKHWVLRIIGTGSESLSLQKLSVKLNLSEKIKFAGALDNRIVRDELAKADLAVLPSRWDGWGAVINEALMSGTPVICSNYCGAADLISNGMNGEIFECGSIQSLTATLERWIVKGPMGANSRAGIVEWSKCIEGDIISRYFIQIMQFLEREIGERPRPPWAV